MWASYDQFLEVVSSNWYSPVYGAPIYILCRRLKFLKGPLKELNKLHFSHISKRVCKLETELELHQSTFQQDRNNHLLLEQDRLLRLKLSNLKSTEKMFFGQKIKCKFLKESDKGSSFFHALMRQNHWRNFIPAIMCSHGHLSTSLKEVGVEFVQYYQHFLGTSKDTLPLDSDVIQYGPCVAPSSHDLLLSPVSNEDIRKAVFSIGNDKAPGPDGYSFFSLNKPGVLWGGIFVLLFKISSFLASSLSRLITLLLLWFPNRLMSHQQMISDQSLAVM